MPLDSRSDRRIAHTVAVVVKHASEPRRRHSGELYHKGPRPVSPPQPIRQRLSAAHPPPSQTCCQACIGKEEGRGADPQDLRSAACACAQTRSQHPRWRRQVVGAVSLHRRARGSTWLLTPLLGGVLGLPAAVAGDAKVGRAFRPSASVCSRTSTFRNT